MIKKKDSNQEDKKIWEDYIKNPSDIYDKDQNISENSLRKERYKFDLHGFSLDGANRKVKEIIEDFLNMIKEAPELKSKNLKDDEKTKLMCLSGVKQYPMRVKCATLSWHTLTTAIDKTQDEIDKENSYNGS